MNEGMLKIILALIGLLGTIITYVLVPWVKTKTTKEQNVNTLILRDEVSFWVSVAVNAAEQIYREKGQGKLKKEYVIDFLTSKGINITIQELDVLIEAAVKELNIVQKTLE